MSNLQLEALCCSDKPADILSSLRSKLQRDHNGLETQRRTPSETEGDREKEDKKINLDGESKIFIMVSNMLCPSWNDLT